MIAPDELALITFPYEWSFSQLQDAALLTLQAQTLAEKHGMTLRDASAYNVQFADGRPILIDTLSFERLDANAPWKPYRQFCEHFLAPLALMARRDPRLGLLLAQYVDGIPLDLASELLPRRTRFSPGLAAHLHLHARSQRRHAGDGAATASVSMSPTRRAALLDHLRRTVSGLSVDPRDTTWAEYADQTSYTEAGTAAKESAVRELLGAVGGAVALDIGANTGRYSAIAVQEGYRVVALDGDWAAVERQYRALRERKETAIMPMLADIASPSPAIGWANGERASLLDRLHGDVAMALALVHHLAIGRNVPLGRGCGLLAGMATASHHRVGAQGGRHGAAAPVRAGGCLRAVHRIGVPHGLRPALRGGTRDPGDRLRAGDLPDAAPLTDAGPHSSLRAGPEPRTMPAWWEGGLDGVRAPSSRSLRRLAWSCSPCRCCWDSTATCST